jgi:GH15 family glucan-1,4-alpha-glucosidase
VTDHGLDLAVIGNGRTAALVDPSARIVWWCFPRFDGDPVFCRLLAGDEEKGFADVVLDGCVETTSEYGRNTPIVTAVMRDGNGAAIRVTDFAPRFYQFGRTFRPPQLVRIIEPIAGLPRVTIRIRPTHHYGQPTQHAMGSNHIRYSGGPTALRVTTDAPLSYVDREAAFVLTHPLHMILGPDTPIDGDLATVCREFLDRTRGYWQEWVRRLAVSYDWQEATIRAAITLKLSNFEETGAIIAAHTTSIPEAPGSGRTWDYRYCWLRDAYFVVRALNRIGATRTMEDFISYILTIVLGRSEKLRPVYSLVPSDPMEERIEPGLRGYGGDGPVRVGNEAAMISTTPTAASFSRLHRCSSIAVCRGWAMSICSGGSNPSAKKLQSSPWCRTLGYGSFADVSAFTLIRRQCAGQAASGWRRSRPRSGLPIVPKPGARLRRACRAKS